MSKRRQPIPVRVQPVVRRWRKLTVRDRLQAGDEVLHNRRWIPATDADGMCWDRQIYCNSPAFRRAISPNSKISGG